MKERIYVCHTYYHVYVTFLKELNLPKEMRGQAALVLSNLSNDFEDLKTRVEFKLKFKKVVGVLTEMKDLQFAEEAVRLGPDFMDRFEDSLIHRQNEQI